MTDRLRVLANSYLDHTRSAIEANDEGALFRDFFDNWNAYRFETNHHHSRGNRPRWFNNPSASSRSTMLETLDFRSVSASEVFDNPTMLWRSLASAAPRTWRPTMIPQQQTHCVGDAVVTRIPELLLRDFTTTSLIPEWDPAIADRHDDGMVPDCLDAAREHVVVSTHGWLVQTPRHTVIVDTAVGNGKTHAIRAFDHLREPWLERLALAWVEPEAVDFVLHTHLHSDHVGWNTRQVDGRWTPTFPNACYIMARREQERLAGIMERDGPDAPKTAFYADSVLPVIQAGQALFIEPEGGEPLPGFTFHSTPGHSTNHMSIALRSGDAYGLFAGDVMHHPIQVYCPQWSSVFSEDVIRGRMSRDWALNYVADTGALVFSSHFPGSSAGRVTHGATGFAWTFV